ncbi:MAG: Rieske (2Fe-2S) protein [Planctomycetota bacterium]|nr:MAG: Rieske (2Fe-2S) protein [Planctomycetota bacterium]
MNAEKKPEKMCCCTGEPRRSFLGCAVAWVFGLVALVPAGLSALAAFFSPALGKGGGGTFVRLTTLDELPADGTPRKFPVVLDQVDAWVRSREPVGAVYLRRVQGDQVEAFQVICPHAGCSVEFMQADDGGQFYCPCHQAHFDLSGKRLDEVSPSPRDLDTLTVELRNGGEVWVEFQNFQVGVAEKKPVA